MDIITLENDNYILDATAVNNIYKFEKEMKRLKIMQDELRKQIKEEMEAKNIKKLETDYFSITYVDDFDTIKLDTKMLKEKYPDINDECSKISHTSSSIKVNFKKITDGNI
jgi:predicted phage-related endonuclease